MRKVLAGLAVLLALGAAGLFAAYHWLDVVVKVALEHYGPEVAGVDVDVDTVRIAARDGRGSLHGLVVGNPPGYAAARAARFGEIRVALDPATLGEDVVRIRELAIESAQVTYERGRDATNLDVIQRHIERYVQRAAPPASKGSGARRAGKRRFVIDRLTIRGARVLMTDTALAGQGLAASLPDVHLRDVGRREGGLTGGEIAALVARTLQNRIARKVLTNIEQLRRGGLEGAVDALRGLLK